MSTQLRVDGSPAVRSYVCFDVQGVNGPVSRATLWVYANSSSSRGISARGQVNPDAHWLETALTYANAPTLSSATASTSGAVVAGRWIALDVTSLVQGNGMKHLALTTAGSTAISLASRHAGANAPYLVVEYR
jgi:hypothetical protein